MVDRRTTVARAIRFNPSFANRILSSVVDSMRTEKMSLQEPGTAGVLGQRVERQWLKQSGGMSID